MRISFGFAILFLLLMTACSGSAVAKKVVPEPAPSKSPPQPASEPSSADQDNPLRNVRFDRAGWKTDFTKHNVPLTEIISGGPPRDGIPPIDKPSFESVEEGNKWLKDNEPVAPVSIKGDAKAYPLQVLIWHEIVNDTVGGVPISVTFCPLCNTALTFERTLDGTVYDFGTSGNLRFSDLVMWDRQTESWWQQAIGEGIVGTLTGKRLKPVPTSIVSWKDFKKTFPRGKVLSKDTGFVRNYGYNPYVGYDNINSQPFLFEGVTDGRLSAMERVVAVSISGQDKAYPFSTLEKVKVVNDTVGGKDVAVFFSPGTSSALDGSSIAGSRDIGATSVFERELEGKRLTFKWEKETIIDKETASSWNILGFAISGPLQDKQLTPVIHGNHFWFAWAAFKPKTTVYKP